MKSHAVIALLYVSFLSLQIHGLSSPTTGSTENSLRPASTTIVVCTGEDCRIDGATQCIRRLQRAVPDGIKVTGRPCLGPCGDGPNVKIVDENDARIVKPQDDRGPGSLVPAELFGSNPRGIYQVRTIRNVEQVVRIATDAAGFEPQEISNHASSSSVVITSSRKLYDRPRNERKVLQRLMQAMVAAGLSQVGEVSTIQIGTAAFLFFLSSFIMKENIFTLAGQLIKKWTR